MDRSNTYSCKREELDRAIIMLHQAHEDHHAELLRGVRDGLIDLVLLDPLAKWEGSDTPCQKPTLTLISDDGPAPAGPRGWRCARGAISWSDGIILHGCAAEPEQYETFVQATVMARKLLLIETSAAHLGAWLAAIPKGKATLIISPRPGESHPVPAGETMQ